MSLPLNARGTFSGGNIDGLFKVLDLREALQGLIPFNRCLIDLRSSQPVDLSALAAFGIRGFISEREIRDSPAPNLHSLNLERVVAPGDAVRVQLNGKINVLYRRGANTNSLFVTERCNSLCLMCSQPPRNDDDSWRISELVDLLPLIDKDLRVMGITGGEPTLLGDDLFSLMRSSLAILPHTSLHVLTNGRKFSNASFADKGREFRDRTIWAIPLYSNVAHRHDHVVQASGAFSETMHGLFNLAEREHRIELRVVLHAQTIPYIDNISEFICRNLPFVQHVALMGLEPMGLARSNRDLLYVDPRECGDQIKNSVAALHQAGLNVSIYNIPLCNLDRSIWPFARQSISDWKNDFTPECDGCQVKASCCGFFRSADLNWRGSNVSPVTEVAA